MSTTQIGPRRGSLMLERRRHQASRQAQAQHLDDVNKPRGKGGRADVAKGEGESRGKGKKGRW
eukprot:5627291-Alexandrium_andersonii.AAC.1